MKELIIAMALGAMFVTQDLPAQDTTPTIREVYTAELGVRELTGNNDGADVEKYLESVGLGKGYAWCAAFVHWCLEQAGIENNVTAWSPTAHNSRNIVWFNRRFEQEPMPGDVFTIWYTSKKRIPTLAFLMGL